VNQQDKTDEDLKRAIRERYAERATAAAATESCGCCCSPSTPAVPNDEMARGLYAVDETGDLPPKAVLASLGCGNPTALADLRPGEVVLDLGSGGGIDVLLAARRVGPAGKAYGVDMTDEMLALARENQAKAGVANVEFLRGEIEDVPLPDASVDVVVSNCVINLSVDKDRVLREAYRVLRPGGRFAVSDIVFQGDLSLVPQELLEDVEAWAGCVAGALEERDYLARLLAAGFTDPAVEVTNVHDGSPANSCCGAPALPSGVRLVSAFVRASKRR
jgi:SAM-dependent methyltransferase